MAFISHKHRFPGLWTPRQAPPPNLPLEINWSNPLAQGLLVAVLGRFPFQNLVNGTIPLVNGGATLLQTNNGVITGPAGVGYHALGNGQLTATVPKFDLSKVKTGLTSYSVFSYQSLNAAQSGGTADTQNPIDADDNTYRIFQLRTAFNQLQFIAFIGGSATTISGPTLSAAQQAIGFTMSGRATTAGNIFLTANGVPAASGSLGGTPNGFGVANALVGLANQTGFGNQGFLGPVYVGLVWGRALSNQEDAAIHADPFAVFRPLVRRTYYSASTGTLISVSEAGTASDTIAETMTAAVAVSESGSAADAEAVSARIADAEAGAAVDTIGEIMSAPISVSEAGTASDTISESMTALISVSEAGTASDTITAVLSGFAIGVSESGSAADTISEVMTALISVSEAGAALDTITLALAGTFFIGVSESGAPADSFTVTGGVQPTPPAGPTAGFDAGPGIGHWFNLAFKAGSGRRRVREGLGAEIEALASPEAAETPEEVVFAAIEALAETEIAAENDALERIWEHEARYAELVGERESLYASTQAFIQAVEAAAREELGRRERAAVQQREDAEMVVILMALG